MREWNEPLLTFWTKHFQSPTLTFPHGRTKERRLRLIHFDCLRNKGGGLYSGLRNDCRRLRKQTRKCALDLRSIPVSSVELFWMIFCNRRCHRSILSEIVVHFFNQNAFTWMKILWFFQKNSLNADKQLLGVDGTQFALPSFRLTRKLCLPFCVSNSSSEHEFTRL